MTFKPREPKWPWRDFLTEEEKAILARADEAKKVWLKLNKERASITNRAIQRAKYAAGREPISLQDALRQSLRGSYSR